jgi:hypothetical protein
MLDTLWLFATENGLLSLNGYVYLHIFRELNAVFAFTISRFHMSSRDDAKQI